MGGGRGVSGVSRVLGVSALVRLSSTDPSSFSAPSSSSSSFVVFSANLGKGRLAGRGATKLCRLTGPAGGGDGVTCGEEGGVGGVDRCVVG